MEDESVSSRLSDSLALLMLEPIVLVLRLESVSQSVSQSASQPASKRSVSWKKHVAFMSYPVSSLPLRFQNGFSLF
jgi:hypothetical protein